MMFNNHNDGIIKPILDLFKKKVKIITTIILVGLSNYIFILIEKNLLTIYLKYTDTDISLF